jgi:hypothetical protein
LTVTHPDAKARVIGTPLHFLDANGTAWHITERDCHGVPGAHGPFCLIFMSEAVFRRIWSYPADWRALSGDELAVLSWHR